MIDRLVEPHPDVTDDEERQKARFLASLLLFVLPAALISTVLHVTLRPDFVDEALWQMPGLAGLAAAYVFSRGRRPEIATWLTIGLANLLVVQGVAADPGNPATYAYLALVAMFATVLVESFGLVVYTGLVLLLGEGLVLYFRSELGDFRALSTGVLVLFFITVSTLVTLYRNRVEAERKRVAADAEAQTRATLLQADRLGSMGRLAAGVAHEINNPLAYVTGNLELLVEQLDGERRQTAQSALDGAIRVQRIVRQLRTFSRQKRTEQVAVDPVRVVRSAVNMARHTVEQNATLIERYDAVPVIDGDETRLGQVVLNLLVNAAEALPSDGTHTIVVEVDELSAGRTRIRVSDSGPGFTEGDLERVFEPFYTTKTEGTGLGLPLSKTIISQLGGTLEITKADIGGACVTVTLPAGTLSADEERTPAPAQSPLVSGRARVLIVDDEPAIRELLEVALSEHDVTSASDGGEALDLDAEDPFDLILCDMTMPIVDGIAFYTRLAEARPGSEQRIVFLTGGTIDEQNASFLHSLPNYVLRKPFRLKDLRRAVQGCLDELGSQG